MTAPPVIALVGPTASGKTDVALALCQLLPCELISADSRQIYRSLDIGTAKPSSEILQQFPHHFINSKNPDEPYSAGMFAKEAVSLVEDIFQRDRIPVVVGGSGLYVRALCEGFFQPEHMPDFTEQRRVLEQRIKQEGIEKLYKELEQTDPVSALRYHDRNPRRILRALEYIYATGSPFSQAQSEQHQQRNFSTLYVGIHHERASLYERINLRTRLMFEQGLIEETNQVLAMGYSPDLNSLQTVGYKESVLFLQDKISRENALHLTQQNTRRYAKRQLTWYRRNNSVLWLQGEPKNIAQLIMNMYISYHENKQQ